MYFLIHLHKTYSAYAYRIIIAVVILIIGFFIIKFLQRLTLKIIERMKVDPSLASFFKSLSTFLYFAVLFIIVLSIAGIPTSYFAGLIIGLATAIGFSLKDEVKGISNGILILLTKPFKVGDAIDVGTYKGVVHDITLFQTQITTFDNLEVVIPNSQMFDNGLIKYNANKTRRQDIIIGVSYDDDVKKVKSILEEVVNKNELVLKEPLPIVVISEFADSSVNFMVRFWTNKDDFMTAKFAINESIKIAFDEKGITIPFPQRDVHLIQEKIDHIES